MFISKKRIDEDLQIFQRSMEYYMSQEMSREKGAKEKTSRIDDSQEPLTFSDFIGLCGAAFVVILPWVFAFAALMGVMGWLLVLWLG